MNVSSLHTLFLVVLIMVFTKIEATEVDLKNPPKGWECINDPSQLPEKVKIIYIGAASGNNPFNPSINISYEMTDASLSEYVALAKNYHEGQGNTRCLHLGKIETSAGEGELLQIDRPSQWGDVRFIQAIFIRNKEAYVVTATCLKKEFGTYSTQILKAIQSTCIKK